jgi:hypothetical protein
MNLPLFGWNLTRKPLTPTSAGSITPPSTTGATSPISPQPAPGATTNTGTPDPFARLQAPEIKPPVLGPGGYGGPAPINPAGQLPLPGGTGVGPFPNQTNVTPPSGAPTPGTTGPLQPSILTRAPAPTPQVSTEPKVSTGMTYVKAPGPSMGVSEEPAVPQPTNMTRAPMPTPQVSTQAGPPQYSSTPYKVSNSMPNTTVTNGMTNATVANQAGNVDLNLSGYNPGLMTTQGARLGDAILSDMTTSENPYVRSIRETAERKATANSYGARQQTEESLGAQGIMPGTSQYSRALARAGAGANSANRDLFNDAAGSQREFYQKALDRAGDWEKMTYDRAVGERNIKIGQAKYGDERSDLQNVLNRDQQKYGDNRSDLQNTLDINKAQYGDERSDKQNSVNETSRLENKGDILSAINAIQDPVARQNAMNKYLAGGDVRAEIGNMFTPEGKLKEEFRSETPGQIKNRAIEDQVRQAFTGRTNPATGKPYTEQEIQDYIGKYSVASLDNQYNPVLQGQRDNLTAESQSRLQQGGTPTSDDIAKLPESTHTSLPFSKSELTAWQGTNKTGGWIKMPNGQAYKVVGQKSPITSYGGMFTSDRHADFLKLQTQDGKTVWMDRNGNITQTEPQDANKGPYDGGLW